MFYKLTDTNNDVFKALADIRAIEREIEARNFNAIKENKDIPEWRRFIGNQGQQNVLRVTQYCGFEFKFPKLVNKKIWCVDRQNKTVYRPNMRTKEGKAMREWLNHLLHGDLTAVLSVLGIPFDAYIVPPFVEVFGEVILVWTDDKHRPTREGFVEITEEEFKQLAKL